MTITDEKLMAYADGELNAAEAAEVERAMAEDEALALRVTLFAGSRKAVREAAMATPLAVPEALAEKVRALGAAHAAGRAAAEKAPDKIVDLSARRRPAGSWQLPLAASIALAIGAIGGWIVAHSSTTPAGLEIAALGDPAIVEALSTLPSGERQVLDNGNQFAAIASFEDGGGRFCREFEYDQVSGTTLVAVACHDQTHWDVRFAIAAPAATPGLYAPASSLETLDAYLSATGAGAPLSTADEAAALSALQ